MHCPFLERINVDFMGKNQQSLLMVWKTPNGDAIPEVLFDSHKLPLYLEDYAHRTDVQAGFTVLWMLVVLFVLL